MFQNLSRGVRCIAPVIGMLIISGATLHGEDRPHPTLVDPAITKCTVCHTDVGATHAGEASSQDCLSCHTFAKKSNKTVLIVDESRRPTAADEIPAPVEKSVEGFARTEDTSTDPSIAESSRSELPPTKTVTEVVVTGRTSTAPDIPVAAAPDRQDPVIASDDSDHTTVLYQEGLAAFDRADFDRAFLIWQTMLANKPDQYIVQVEVDTYLETARSTVSKYRDHALYIVKKDGLYWVFTGVFETRAKAHEQIGLLPEPLRAGGAFPIAVRRIVPQ